MRTVSEVEALTGVTVRTLHYYDSIGLLSPSEVTEAGYRLYNDEAMRRLQFIMLLRELKFPLSDIKNIIDAPDFDRQAALRDQIQMLRLQRERLDKLIELTENILKSGVSIMDFSAFDNKKLEEYAAEAKKKYGKTEAYKEFEEKSKGMSADDKKNNGVRLLALFGDLGKLRTQSPDSAEVQTAVEAIRKFISDNFYNCTVEIFRGLGEMYSVGGEMTDNIDKAGGEGTAEFATKAIKVYCDNAK